MSTARDVVMRRIRDALGSSPPVPGDVVREYRHAGEPVDFDPVERFCEVVADYDATVHRVDEAGLADALGETCRARGPTLLIVPVDAPWEPAGVALVRDDPPLSARDLDG